MHQISPSVRSQVGTGNRPRAGTRNNSISAPHGATPNEEKATSSFRSVSQKYVRALVVLDLAVGLASFGIVQVIDRLLLPDDVMPRNLALLGAGLWPVLIGLSHGYRRRRVGVGTSELRAVLRAGPVLLALSVYPAVVLSHIGLVTIAALIAPLCVTLSLAGRLIARGRLHKLQKRGIGTRRTLAVGTLDAVIALEDAVSREPFSGMEVTGACVPLDAGSDGLGVPVMGGLQDVKQVLARGGFEAVAVTGGDCLREEYLRHLAWSLEGLDVELLVAPGLAEVVRKRLDIRPVIGMPLLVVQQPRFSGWQHRVKRTLDIVLTSAGLMALSPLLIGVAIAIKLQDGGPVFFRQTRIGRDGKPFQMLKFRSMMVDAEARKAELMDRNEGNGGLFKLRDDPRITPLGKFIRNWSIDELPQLFNVLCGSMSLVGPRPHLAHELAQMPADASRRALVTPGLTGLWQISGRSDLPGSEGVRLDLRYVENWSITLDLMIIWKTFRAVLTQSGAH